MTTPSSTPSNLTHFLTNNGLDHAGRTYDQILSQDDMWLETHHDWVQWCFPLFEPSQAVRNAPVLQGAEQVAQIQVSAVAQQHLAAGVARYSEFLRQNDHWLRFHDHNHLRITRVIKALRILASDAAADDFHEFVLDQVNTRSRRAFSPRVLEFLAAA